MGLIVCKKHGRTVITLMTEALHENFVSGQKIEVILFILKDIDVEFPYFICSYEYPKFFALKNCKTIKDLDDKSDKITGNNPVCGKCFNEYLEVNNIQVQEKVVAISLED